MVVVAGDDAAVVRVALQAHRKIAIRGTNRRIIGKL
jgi:hypothetical protein